jgi:hypothetical protein
MTNYYVEYCIEPFKRDGTMVPVSALTDIYQRDDAGYTTYYWFTEEAANEIRAQGRSVGLSRFSVFSRYVVLDIDREDDMFSALADTYSVSNELRARGLKHSVWWSGSKGAHIYIHCVPRFGIEVPHSQLVWVRQQGWKVDETLYQHGRLLSNPGRKSKKTGVRKHKMFDVDGELLDYPLVSAPVKKASVAVTNQDLARVALFRVQKALESDPSSRHQAIWSLSMALFEAGAQESLVIDLMRFTNSFWSAPKDDAGLLRAITQAKNQAGVE